MKACLDQVFEKKTILPQSKVDKENEKPVLYLNSKFESNFNCSEEEIVQIPMKAGPNQRKDQLANFSVLFFKLTILIYNAPLISF